MRGKFRQLIKCFSMDLNALETSKIINISYKSCKNIFHKLRIYIFTSLLKSDISKGEFELDESYFGAKRVRGKRGRGAAGKAKHQFFKETALRLFWTPKKRWKCLCADAQKLFKS